MPERKCYEAYELAHMLGYATDWFYRKGNLEALYGLGMPRSVTLGRIRVPRQAFDAWLAKDDPRTVRFKTPANDLTPRQTPQNDHDWRRYLAQANAR